MQLHPTTNGSSCSVEAVIVACSETVQAMAWKFVRNCRALRLEFDDLYATGMLAVCEAAPRLQEGVNPFPYLLRAAKFAMIDEYRRARGLSSTLSLDAPLGSDDDSFCLGDLLAAPTPGAPAPAPTEEEAAVLDALWRLPGMQGPVLARRYGLDGYGACNLKETAQEMQITVPSVDGAAARGRRNLARDARLCAALKVEAVQL